jgi:TolA protein
MLQRAQGKEVMMPKFRIFERRPRCIAAVLFLSLAITFLSVEASRIAWAQDASDPQREAYESTIHKIIAANFEAPRVAKTKKLTCQVDIEIDKDGKVQKYSVTQKSGSKTFDEAVTRAVDKVKELPPPPVATMLDIELTFQSKGKPAAQ